MQNYMHSAVCFEKRDHIFGNGCGDENHLRFFSMFSWLFGSSTGKEEGPSQKVDDAILEARIVKDFYDRY